MQSDDAPLLESPCGLGLAASACPCGLGLTALASPLRLWPRGPSLPLRLWPRGPSPPLRLWPRGLSLPFAALALAALAYPLWLWPCGIRGRILSHAALASRPQPTLAALALAALAFLAALALRPQPTSATLALRPWPPLRLRPWCLGLPCGFGHGGLSPSLWLWPYVLSLFLKTLVRGAKGA